MSEILFLCHCLPYPPDKGEKIRTYHLLAGLCARHRVYLGCLVEKGENWSHTEHLKTICAGSYFAPLRRPLPVSTLRALAGGEAVTISHHRHRGLAAWARSTLEARRPACIYVMSSAMAQYAEMSRYRPPRAVLDFVDVDSEKWRAYAAASPWPQRWLYRREAERLLGHDRAAARNFDYCLFVSDAEAGRFRELAPELGPKTRCLRNGVDASYFTPERPYPDPYDGGASLVFTGTMSYRPNEEGAAWFAREVMPRLRRSIEDIRFAIVGREPGRRLRALDGRHGVSVVGAVPDVRPYLAHAAAVVAPLRQSPGVANKVLEGLAMAKTVVASPQAVSGLELENGRDALIAADADEFVEVLGRLLGSGAPRHNSHARARVLSDFTWEATIASLAELLEARVTGS